MLAFILVYLDMTVPEERASSCNSQTSNVFGFIDLWVMQYSFELFLPSFSIEFLLIVLETKNYILVDRDWVSLIHGLLYHFI